MLLQGRGEKKEEFISKLNISKKTFSIKELRELPRYDKKANKSQKLHTDIVQKYKVKEGESEYLSFKVKKFYI